MNPKKAEGYDKIPQRKNVVLLGTPLVQVMYGLCRTHRMTFAKNGRLVYKWDKIDENRKEFFFGQRKLARQYEGDQFCFIEYCVLASEKNDLPEERDLANTGLDKTVMEIYRSNLMKITGRL